MDRQPVAEMTDDELWNEYQRLCAAHASASRVAEMSMDKYSLIMARGSLSSLPSRIREIYDERCRRQGMVQVSVVQNVHGDIGVAWVYPK